MSINVSPIFQIEFSAQVKAAYDRRGGLRTVVDNRTGVIGNTYHFRRSGRGMAVPHVPFTSRQAMNTTFTPIVCNLQAWDATEFVDSIEEMFTNAQYRARLAENVSRAIGGREDQTIIDALVAGFGGGATIGASATGLTDAKMREVVRRFEDRGVPAENRHMLISAVGYDNLLAETRYSSQDFGGTNSVRDGRLPTVYGVQMHVVETRPEGGLPTQAGPPVVRQNFAFDSMAVGVALGRENALVIERRPDITAWQINQQLAIGAVIIDPDGVIRVDTQE